MRLLVLAVFLLAIVSESGAQEKARVTGDQSGLTTRNWVRLMEAAGWPRASLFISKETDVNAYAQLTQGRVVLPLAMIRFFQDDESGLAYVVAHEIGHIVDAECKWILTLSKPTLAQRRSCEARADAYAVGVMVLAHYNPYAAAGAIGKQMMFYGTATVTQTIMGRFWSDHPADLDRINLMRETLISVCRQYPQGCVAQP